MTMVLALSQQAKFYTANITCVFLFFLNEIKLSVKYLHLDNYQISYEDK